MGKIKDNTSDKLHFQGSARIFLNYRASEFEARTVAQKRLLQVACSFYTDCGFAVGMISSLYTLSSEVILYEGDILYQLCPQQISH